MSVPINALAPVWLKVISLRPDRIPQVDLQRIGEPRWLVSRKLEKAIAGEFHEFTLLAQRLERSGIVRKVGGTSRNGLPAEGLDKK